MEKTILIILQWDESFDIGSDTITGVNDADYRLRAQSSQKYGARPVILSLAGLESL